MVCFRTVGVKRDSRYRVHAWPMPSRDYRQGVSSPSAHATAPALSKQFIRSGDDSLMVWASNLTVTNATVWQNYNGGVVNLGWSDNSKGEHVVDDGLYVGKTDWQT